MWALFVWVTIVLYHFQLKNWKVLPDDKSIVAAYSRVSGQEWFYADLKKQTIDDLIKVRE